MDSAAGFGPVCFFGPTVAQPARARDVRDVLEFQRNLILLDLMSLVPFVVSFPGAPRSPSGAIWTLRIDKFAVTIMWFWKF